MRSAVPSSKVGSCDTAAQPADRDSGVEAAGFAVAARAGVVPEAAAAGLAAVLLGATFCPIAGGAAKAAIATATIVVLRMRVSVPGAGRFFGRLISSRRVAF